MTQVGKEVFAPIARFIKAEPEPKARSPGSQSGIHPGNLGPHFLCQEGRLPGGGSIWGGRSRHGLAVCVCFRLLLGGGVPFTRRSGLEGTVRPSAPGQCHREARPGAGSSRCSKFQVSPGAWGC